MFITFADVSKARRFVVVVFASCLVFLPPAVAQDKLSTRFSLQESVTYALAHNRDIQNTQLSKEIAYQDVRKLLATGLPSLKGSVNYNYQLAIQQTILPDFITPAIYNVLATEGILPFPRDRNFGVAAAQFGTKNNVNAGLTLNQLLISGTYFVVLRAAKLLRQLADKDFISSEIDLVAAVHNAYYLCIIAEKRSTLVLQNQHRLQQLLAETRLLYANGFVEKVDVDRLQVNANLLVVERQQADNEIALSRRLLNLHMGLPVMHPTELTDTLLVTDVSTQLVDNDLSLSTHIDYLRYQLSEDIAFLDFKRAKSKRYPELSFKATVGYNTGNDVFSELIRQTWYPYSALSLNLQFPIFDSFLKIAVQQKKRTFLQIRNSKVKLAQNLKHTYTQAHENLKSHLIALRAQETNRSLAESVYNVSKEKYTQGLESNLAVFTAASTLKEVETQYYMALYQVMVAQVAWRKATSTLYTK